MDQSMFIKYCATEEEVPPCEGDPGEQEQTCCIYYSNLPARGEAWGYAQAHGGSPFATCVNFNNRLVPAPETMERIANLSREARPLNRAGVPMTLGTDLGYKDNYYYGRFLGVANIPGSGGRCGPSNGPHCADCLVLTRTSPTPPSTPSPSSPSQPPSPSIHVTPNQTNSQLPHYYNDKLYATKLLKNSGQQADVYEGVRVSRDNSRVKVALKIFRNEDDWDDCKVELISLFKARNQSLAWSCGRSAVGTLWTT